MTSAGARGSTDGARGFRVFIGGGTATMTTAATVLFEFLPVEEMLNVAEAVLRVFHARGDYQHKQRNRMKFLIKSMGWEAFRAAFDEALREVRAEGGRPLAFDSLPASEEAAPTWPRAAAPAIAEIVRRVAAATLKGPGILPVRHQPANRDASFSRWMRSNVRPQKQSGYATVTITVPLGDLSGEQFRVLADLSQAYGDGSVRVSAVQNVVLRWVPEREVLGALRIDRRGGPWPAGRRYHRRRDELPRRGVMQARGDAVARARAGGR